MTKDYATLLWSNLLRQLKKTGTDRVIQNPAIEFTKKAKAGGFDAMSDEDYMILLGDVEEEAALFDEKTCASSYAVLIRALRHLSFTKSEYGRLLNILAAASARVDFKEAEL